MLGRVKAWFAHSRTIFAARLLHLAAGAVAAHDFVLPFVTGQDWTPITAKIPAWAWPLVLAGIGATFEYLRRITRTSLEAKAQAAAASSTTAQGM